MQAKIHPEYTETNVVCACGNKFVTRSTYKGDTMKVDICSECHPFYTGKDRVVDTQGRVSKFNDKYS